MNEKTMNDKSSADSGAPVEFSSEMIPLKPVIIAIPPAALSERLGSRPAIVS